MESAQKNKKPLKFWIALGAIALVVILAVVLILVNRAESKNSDWSMVVPGEAQQGQNGEMTPGQEGGQPVTDSEGNPVTDSDGNTVTETVTNAGGSDTGETIAENSGPVPTVGNEDPYEQCLVSAMIVGVSMQYSDYEFLGIYTASDTPVYDHNSSAGAYLIFNGDGEKRALKATPLAGERADRGTADIYVAALGYATYELVDPDSVPVGSLKEHKLEDLVELISAYSLVSIIER